MKRIVACLLALALFLSACKADSGAAFLALAKKEKDLLIRCAEEMRALGRERVYAAMEVPGDAETETATGTVPAEPRLVLYQKASDEREEIADETISETLARLGLRLILFQTASDGRESVIFSTGEEGASGVICGAAYSFDGEPVGWWGRKADLKRHKGRFVEINEKGDAWYYAVPLGDGLYYWEKEGALLG